MWVLGVGALWVWVWVEFWIPTPTPTPMWWVFRGKVGVGVFRGIFQEWQYEMSSTSSWHEV